jgi:hypothetical protein
MCAAHSLTLPLDTTPRPSRPPRPTRAHARTHAPHRQFDTDNGGDLSLDEYIRSCLFLQTALRTFAAFDTQREGSVALNFSQFGEGMPGAPTRRLLRAPQHEAGAAACGCAPRARSLTAVSAAAAAAAAAAARAAAGNQRAPAVYACSHVCG